MNEAPVHWVKQIQDILIEAQSFPMAGQPPAFPWDALSEKIGELLHAPETKITPRKMEQFSPEAFASGLGAGYLTIAIELTPLTGQVFWLMGKEDVAKLGALTLLNSNGGKGFSSSKFQEGFYYFLATQAIAAIDSLGAFKDLSPKIGKFSVLPQEDALCIDIEIEHPKATLWGRLVCPTSFKEAFVFHFGNQPPPPLTSDLAQQIDVSLRLEIGHTALPLSRWKKVSVGDFIMLDRCTFDPETLKGTAMLVLENNPLLRARIKDNSIKILDYASYKEELDLQNPELPEEEIEESFEEPEMPPSEFETEPTEEERHLWETQNGEAEEKPAAPIEVPSLFIIETTRLHINLDKLLQLTPGSVLEYSIQPEHGVEVTLDGKMVARAELVKLGEMIGIKILQLGA